MSYPGGKTMSTILRPIGVAAIAAVLVVAGLSAFVIASPASASETPAGLARGGRGLCGEAGLAAAAEALGFTPEELQTQLRAGESLADLADEAGADVADVLTAIDAACLQTVRDAIEEAVTEGDLSREHADWLLEGLDNGFWGPGRQGRGFGFGLRGGHGGPRFGDERPIFAGPRLDS
jgi:hypothetical protein